MLGEIAAGLALGPSVLDVGRLLVPDSTASTLGFLAKLGVVLFMFLVGLEFDPTALRGRTHATLSISHASIVVPFALGTALALALFPRYGVGTLGFAPFALFIGVSVSVTAFPVLVRILASRRLHRTSAGVTAIACAAIDDATAWCLLASSQSASTRRRKRFRSARSGSYSSASSSRVHFTGRDATVRMCELFDEPPTPEARAKMFAAAKAIRDSKRHPEAYVLDGRPATAPARKPG